MFCIGTSGWSYPHWQGTFYPEQLAKSRWFEFYCEHFSSVEVNATFYRSFKDQTYRNWYAKAPPGFSYVLKVPRLITHRKYLLHTAKEIEAFTRSASILQEKLGLMLLQLHPHTPYDIDRLEKALRAFENPQKVAVEFRHKQWLSEEVKSLLAKYGTVYCAPDSPDTSLVNWLTGNAAYFRLHGRSAWYVHDYTEEELKGVAGLAQQMSSAGAARIYIFFNNDANAFAPKNARRMLELLT